MKLVFLTNVWNHYQGALGKAFAEVLGPQKFRMILWQQIDAERKRVGWEGDVPNYPWLTSLQGGGSDPEKSLSGVCEADIALLGASPRWMQIQRARTGKLTFIAAERMWKQPLRAWQYLNPRFAVSLHRYRTVARQPNTHYLAIGGYAASDARLVGGFGGGIWTWGYFCDVPQMAPPVEDQAKVQILWAGRMLGWKRVDTLLEAVAAIQDTAEFGHLRVIGAGPEEAAICELARKLNLGCRCIIQPPVPPAEIREQMRNSAIYVMPSDRNEGWGVVANEAMAEGAVLVANRDAGAAPVLVADGETGMLFDSGRADQLALVLRRLVADSSLRARLRMEAWRRLSTLWSPAVAARRFIALCEGLLGSGPMPRYDCGPCSPA